MKGLKTLVIENDWLDRRLIECGWGNGYVLLPKEHKYYEKHYDSINNINIHGGLTFSQKVSVDMVGKHGILEEDVDKWMIGFDTAHYQDSLETWSKEAVEAETQKLYSQLLPKQLEQSTTS